MHWMILKSSLTQYFLIDYAICEQRDINKTILRAIERADRSGVDRDIRNVEAAGSNPAQSTLFFIFIFSAWASGTFLNMDDMPVSSV